MRSNTWLMMCATLAIVFALVSETSAQSANLQIKGPRDAQDQYSGATYGPIDASDTLWRISSRYRQNQSLSVYQVMLAIYELNPDAFEQENINLLIDGAVLRLPSERYVARIDLEQARQRAELDDQALVLISSSEQAQAGNNIKPPTELVNKSDLTDTKNQIEQQINRLDEKQLEQFELLRQQFAASIDNVQALIDENQKVFERLDNVNQDISELRSQVDDQVKPQIDQQIALQQELLELIKGAEARQQEQEATSWTKKLTSPMAMIIGSTVFTLLLIGGLVFWLIKRSGNQLSGEAAVTQAGATNTPMATQPKIDDLGDSLVEDLATPDADDDLFNDDELLDDVLSEELEESLDDAVENELDSYADLSDEMLVPDVADDSDSLFEDDDDELLKELDEVSIDELDSIDLSDDNDIDLADSIDEALDEELVSELDAVTDLENDSLDELFEEEELSEVDMQLVQELTGDDDDIEAILDAELDSNIAASDDIESSLDSEVGQEIESAPSDDSDEKPEISIDELLDDTPAESESPPGVEVDVETGVSNQMLEQLEDEVASQNAEIDKVTDEILGELEQIEMMQGMMGDDDLMDDESDESETDEEPAPEIQQDIQSLDEFASDLDDVDIDELGELDDPLSDDLLTELGATEESQDFIADETDALADELLAELGVEEEGPEPESEKQPEEPAEVEALDETDALADELLAELDIEEEAPAAESEKQSEESAEIESLDETDALADELLAELDIEDEAPAPEQGPELEEATEDDTPALTAELDEIPSFAENEPLEEFSFEEDIDDSVLEQAFDEFEVEDEEETFELDDGEPASSEASSQDEKIDELDDLPGLGDWLSDNETDDSVILEEIESADFDDLLESIDSDDEVESELKLDNPDLDLDVLFTEPDTVDSDDKKDFVDVDTLLEESAADDGSRAEETNLNLDVALSEFTGISEDDVVVDVDEGGTQAANLDLAQAYLEMDDKEAAIELLKEVSTQGTDEQKKEALSIIESLA